MTYIPPKLYTISNPYNGGIYIPVAIVSNYTVNSIGTTRVLSDHLQDGLTNSRIIIPEAYKVSITFRELIPQSSNIMLGAMGGSKISVINNTALSDINSGITQMYNFFATGQARDILFGNYQGAQILTDQAANYYINGGTEPNPLGR